MILLCHYILLENYSKATLDRVHIEEYDKLLWGDIFNHLHYQIQHLYEESINPYCHKLYQEVREEFYTSENPLL